MKAIDLYSGIGGWSLGLKLAGIDIIRSYEWWKDANLTHNKNFGSNNKDFDIRKLDIKEDLPKEKLNFIVGSPPCTQFSFSNRGGKGDIGDGLVDIYKFLEVIEEKEPKYWAMENVPRVAKILETQLEKGQLSRFRYLFNNIQVYNTSDFGVPQDRKRMVAGNLPFQLLDEYKSNSKVVHLGDVIKSLQGERVVDPVFGFTLPKEELSDHIIESYLTEEEVRLNKESKTHHPVYNKMSFPDRIDRPSRTVTALCTRVSRESIVINDGNGYRRLTVRERACLQSFPINYQFFGSSYANKIKMIGNAIPPILTFFIAQAMKEVKTSYLKSPQEVCDKLTFYSELATSSLPDIPKRKYSPNRKFRMAIKGLRYGSGMRFDLYNDFRDSIDPSWSINFYYGNSKQKREKDLNLDLLKQCLDVLGAKDKNRFKGYFQFLQNFEDKALQQSWIHKSPKSLSPIEMVDAIGRFKEDLESQLQEKNLVIEGFIREIFSETIDGVNSKIIQNAKSIFVGFILGSAFNNREQALKLLKIKKPIGANY